MTNRFVSVVIPAYNAERFVGEAIQSALEQTVQPLEVIVVDDGSTDGTGDVLKSFGGRIRSIAGHGRSAAASRNLGAASASGSWLAFLDADDAWLPTKLERQLEFAHDPRIALVYTDRFNIGDRGLLPERQGEIQEMYSGDVFEDLLTKGNQITLSSVLLRKDVFHSLGGFAENLKNAEDWDLSVRVAERHRVGVCREPLVRYRFHSGMKSGDPVRMQKARLEVVRRALCGHRGRALPTSTRLRILSATARTNAWDAARRGAHASAWREYGRALVTWPFHLAPYRDLARYALRRTG